MNRFLALTALLALGMGAALAQPDGMVLVRGGTYQPLYESATGPDEVAVESFFLGATAVTNAEYLAFVRANPEWRRSAVKPKKMRVNDGRSSPFAQARLSASSSSGMAFS